VDIRPETNEVVIGDNTDTFHNELIASKINLMSIDNIDSPINVTAKIRYSHKGAPCTVRRTGEDELLCSFNEPVRAITPGQAVVFYDGDVVVGGATIDRVIV
jgi:tRNA-specific 2-thiouridylase